MLSPELLFWSELALKMAMTAAVVVAVAAAVERSSPFVGALVASLPTAAGAAYVVLAIEHPPNFIAASAIGSVVSSAGIAIFAAAYAMLAQRHGLFVSLGLSLLVWLAIAAALRLVAWSPPAAVAFNVAVYAVTIPVGRRYRHSGPLLEFIRRPYDIPLRALAAAVVVALVTTASTRIGSFASGIFAVFPIILCSSIVILQPRLGGQATASMLAHAQLPLIGLSLAFLAVHYLAEPLGSWWALVAGLLVSIAWSGALLAHARLRIFRPA